MENYTFIVYFWVLLLGNSNLLIVQKYYRDC